MMGREPLLRAALIKPRPRLSLPGQWEWGRRPNGRGLSGAANSMQSFWPILRSEPNLNFALSSGAAPASCKAAFYEL